MDGASGFFRHVVHRRNGIAETDLHVKSTDTRQYPWTNTVVVAILGTVKLPIPMDKLYTYVDFAQNRMTSVNYVMNLRNCCLTKVMNRTCYGLK